MVRSMFLLLVGAVVSPIIADVCNPLTTADDISDGHNLFGKVAIVTGGDSGLGFAVAESFAKQNATVVIAGHSEAKCQAAAHNLTVLYPGTTVQSLPIDLSSFANIRAFASKFLAMHGQKLHYLINDAGMSGMEPDRKTDDGFEMVFQVNYLGHFLLTELLLPALRESRPSRVVAVASEMHVYACVQAGFQEDCAKDFELLPPPLLQPGHHFSMYGFSKLMMIEHAAELTARESSAGVTAYSLCPGLVVTPMTKDGDFIKASCAAMSPPQDPCPFNAQQGAAVIAHAALGDATPGLWYQRRMGCKAGVIVPHGFTDAMRPELYKRSREWVGLEVPLADSAKSINV